MVKLALIGKDVSQSSSPEIHNFISARLGVEITYDKVSIAEEDFGREIKRVLREYDGFNVTIPYKLAIIPHLKKIADDALVFGSVNTVVSATLTGYKTDGMGFMQMLGAEGVNVSGERVLLLGAGGAGRSVAKKLAAAGAKLEIYDRNADKAEQVAAESGACAVDKVTAKERRLIVNATGVGMHKTVGLSPVPEEVLANTDIAADLIYVPEKSEFLRIAERAGKKIINGKAMLFYQAYYSDCYYFGLTPSSAVAADLFKEYLKENQL